MDLADFDLRDLAERMDGYASFYFNRPAVSAERIPTLHEISRRECADLVRVFREAEACVAAASRALNARATISPWKKERVGTALKARITQYMLDVQPLDYGELAETALAAAAASPESAAPTPLEDPNPSHPMDSQRREK